MIRQELTERMKRAQQAVADAGLDMLFIVGRENLIYFTGTTQLECMSIIIPRTGDPVAVTLWLDVEYVREVCPNTKVIGYAFPGQSLIGKSIEIMQAFGYENPRIGFEKYFVEFSVFDGLRKVFSQENFVSASDLIYKLRAVKSEHEIEMIRRASAIVAWGMDAAVKAVQVGVMEVEVLAEADYAMMKAGSGGSSFRMQVSSGDRSLLTHPCASNKRLVSGEAVVIHLGATYEGYCSKMCRTVALGEIPAAQVKTFELLREAQSRALTMLKPGSRSWEVDKAARDVIDEAGFGNLYLELVGYGVGLRQSEFYPMIGRGRQDRIEENMVIDILLPTLYKKGIGGPRITDVIHVTATEPVVLTDYPRELIFAGEFTG